MVEGRADGGQLRCGETKIFWSHLHAEKVKVVLFYS